MPHLLITSASVVYQAVDTSSAAPAAAGGDLCCSGQMGVPAKTAHPVLLQLHCTMVNGAVSDGTKSSSVIRTARQPIQHTQLLLCFTARGVTVCGASQCTTAHKPTIVVSLVRQ
jgi:hypothetical protein